MTPIVSVIIPCYNSAAFLREAIDCALGQTCQCQEVIVVDDGSSDGSPAIMAEYGDRIRIVRQANAGLPAARNAGIAVASGRYLAFLDADDYWREDFLEKMLARIEAVAGNAIAYCGWQNVGLPASRCQPFVPPDYEAMPNKRLLLLEHPRWPVHASMVPRALAVAVGGFDPTLRSCEDFDFWLKTALDAKLMRVPEVLAFYRHHPGQMTKRRAENALYQLHVQQRFFQGHPAVRKALGRNTTRRIQFGELRKKAFECYWDRDLDCARTLFRQMIRAAYGHLADWKYMLPALLPLSLHKQVIRLLENPALSKPHNKAGKI